MMFLATTVLKLFLTGLLLKFKIQKIPNKNRGSGPFKKKVVSSGNVTVLPSGSSDESQGVAVLVR